jgi:HK97 family phage major capsid protein
MYLRDEDLRSTSFCRDMTGSVVNVDDTKNRMVPFKFSTSEPARDGHIVFTGGIQTANFISNPVFQWSHDTTIPPIGRVANLRKRSDELIGDVEYAEHEFAQLIFQLVKSRFINATSISWLPIEWKYSTDPSRKGGIDFTKVDLLEISQVPVPALPSALATARSQGIDTRPLYEWCERTLDTGNETIVLRSDIEILRREAKMPAAAKPRAQAIVMPARRQKFRSLAENVRAAIDATTRRHIDEKLERSPYGLNTPDVTAGGFLINEEFSNKWIASIYGSSPFADLCDRRQTENRLAKLKIPGIDETSRADGFRNGGVLGVWTEEGTQVNATLPRWKMIEFSGNKLEVLVFGTNELLNDAPMFEAHLNKVVPDEFAFQLDQKIISGSGAGVPLGILNSSCLITLPKVSGQAAATIVTDNVLAMWRRLPAPSRRRAVWLVNEDADTQLEILATDTAGPPNIYIPAGVFGNEFPLLKGRPTIAVEQCPVIGQTGDIILADLSNYIVVDGSITPAVSLHVQFVADQVVLRFTWYVDGRTTFATPITPYNGSQTRSPFITLGTR